VSIRALTRRIDLRALAARLGVSQGVSLPYSVDFTTLADGALPAEWSGGEWAIAGGLAVCTPVTYSAELLTDPGLEGTYTSGQANALTVKTGSPTLTESADARSGSKAQQFIAVATNNALGWALVTGQANRWLLMTLWAKRTAGTAGKTSRQFHDGSAATLGWQAVFRPFITNASYDQLKHTRLVAGNVLVGLLEDPAAVGGDTIIMDDGSLKALTTSELITAVLTNTANVAVKSPLTTTLTTQLGVVARLDDPDDPQNFLIAILTRQIHSSNGALLLKCVNGVYTGLVAGWITYAAGRVLELRASGTSVSMWYNDVQVGTTQTVTDATITSNKYHGVFSTDAENGIRSFFLSALT
jgi:hypothetical protein